MHAIEKDGGHVMYRHCVVTVRDDGAGARAGQGQACPGGDGGGAARADRGAGGRAAGSGGRQAEAGGQHERSEGEVQERGGWARGAGGGEQERTAQTGTVCVWGGGWC